MKIAIHAYIKYNGGSNSKPTCRAHSRVYYYNNPFICGKHRSSYVLDNISLPLDSRNKLVLDNFPLTELVSWPETFMCLVTHTTHTIDCSHPKE